MERRRCLEVLGLPPGSSEEEIKKSYKALARQYHPDKNDAAAAKEKFQEINEAYMKLTDTTNLPADFGAHGFMDMDMDLIRFFLFQEMMNRQQHHPYFYDDSDDVYFDEYESEDEYVPQTNHGNVNGFQSEAERRKERRQEKRKRQKARQKEKRREEKEEKEKLLRQQKQQQEKQKHKDKQQKDPYSDDINGLKSFEDNSKSTKVVPEIQQEKQLSAKQQKKRLLAEQNKREHEMKELAEQLKKQVEKDQAKMEKKKEAAKAKEVETPEVTFDWLNEGKKSRNAKQREKKKAAMNPLKTSSPVTGSPYCNSKSLADEEEEEEGDDNEDENFSDTMSVRSSYSSCKSSNPKPVKKTVQIPQATKGNKGHLHSSSSERTDFSSFNKFDLLDDDDEQPRTGGARPMRAGQEDSDVYTSCSWQEKVDKSLNSYVDIDSYIQNAPPTVEKISPAATRHKVTATRQHQPQQQFKQQNQQQYKYKSSSQGPGYVNHHHPQQQQKQQQQPQSQYPSGHFYSKQKMNDKQSSSGAREWLMSTAAKQAHGFTSGKPEVGRGVSTTMNNNPMSETGISICQGYYHDQENSVPIHARAQSSVTNRVRGQAGNRGAGRGKQGMSNHGSSVGEYSGYGPNQTQTNGGAGRGYKKSNEAESWKSVNPGCGNKKMGNSYSKKNGMIPNTSTGLHDGLDELSDGDCSDGFSQYFKQTLEFENSRKKSKLGHHSNLSGSLDSLDGCGPSVGRSQVPAQSTVISSAGHVDPALSSIDLNVPKQITCNIGSMAGYYK